MDDYSINLTIPSLNLASPDTPTQRRKSRTQKQPNTAPKSPSSSIRSGRGGPEGDSVTLKHKFGPLPTGNVVQTTVTPKKSAKKRTKSKSESEENHSPSPPKITSPATAANTSAKSDGKKNVSRTSSRSPASAKKSRRRNTSRDINETGITDQATILSKVTKKGKVSSDESWERAVEKARGLPEGAACVEEEEEDSGEPSSVGKYEKGKKKPFNVSVIPVHIFFLWRGWV